ncbi:MAG: hypothetical protein ABR915_13195 [Thermoguttaceae bacterium]
MSSKQQRPPGGRRYQEMNARELAKATAEFDRELVIDRSRELTAEEKARWQRARRKPGRPKVGKGVQVISVSIEKGLLTRADRLGRKLQLPRTQLIALGLEALLENPSLVQD